jgi:non-ribosomal peptide synthetase component E (peptide arylation enzyme)
MSELRQAARVGAVIERWREAAAMAIAALAVIAMLAVGISRMHESHATRVSPAEFFNGGKTAAER